MSLDIVVLVAMVLLVCMVFIAFRQNGIKEALRIVDENQRVIASNQREMIEKNQEQSMKFMYEKLSLLDEKQLSLATKVHESVEKNIELFSALQNSQVRLEKNIQQILFQKLDSVSEKVDKRLESINAKVEERLSEGFKNIDTTFKQIIASIARINEAQKNIENLSTQVGSLQNILTDKKTRGIYGEVQLNNILRSIFGEKQELYVIQHKLSNGFIVDAGINAPKPMGFIGIDSKFPLENFRRLSEDESYKGIFSKDMKKHIDAISEKYIIANETADMAILFLPAEAIFAHINAYLPNIIEYARSKNVWISSPTTLMALITTLLAIVKDIKMKKQAKKIQEELVKLSQNFKLYRSRWEDLSKHIDRVHKDVKDITITTSKISNQFEKIENVDLEESERLEDGLI